MYDPIKDEPQRPFQRRWRRYYDYCTRCGEYIVYEGSALVRDDCTCNK